MRGGDKPTMRKLRAGALLTEQGQPGDEVFLVLDGVLAVEVDGEPIAELGPGAILGERAVLEGGVRTSTIVRSRSAGWRSPQGDQLDRKVLEQISAGHRREQTSSETALLRRPRVDAGARDRVRSRRRAHVVRRARARRRAVVARCSTRAPGSGALTDDLDGDAFSGTLLLTHLHWDHVEGLPFFAAGDRDDSHVRCCIPDQGATSAAEALARGMSPPHFPIGPDGLRGDWSFEGMSPAATASKGFDVDAFDVPHKGGRTYGFRIDD